MLAVSKSVQSGFVYVSMWLTAYRSTLVVRNGSESADVLKKAAAVYHIWRGLWLHSYKPHIEQNVLIVIGIRTVPDLHTGINVLLVIHPNEFVVKHCF